MAANVVVLGGGVGGTLAANLLDKELGKDVRITVVDPTGMHLYQPGFLYVALGQANGRWLSRDERKLLRKGIDLVIDGAKRIDSAKKTVELASGGRIDYDYLVIATGSRVVPEQVPGLAAAGHHFYTLDGALALREELRRFKGGKLLVGVAGIPYKCPPAPVEFVLMLEEYLRQKGIRNRTDLALLSPLNRAFTVEAGSQLVQPVMEYRGIRLETFFNAEEVDPEAGVVTSLEGEKADFDLLVLVPPHKGAKVIGDSGIGGPGDWLPTDRHTLEVAGTENVYAIGDATDLPISKSGSTAHFEAPVVASRIASLVKGTAPKTNYGGKVMCFFETGGRKATVLRFDYDNPPEPPKRAYRWHVAKWMFNRLYWVMVPQGRIPERFER